MEREEIKKTITEAIKAAQEQGYTLVKGCWMDKNDNNSKCSCALGCLVAMKEKDLFDFSPKIQKLLGVDAIWVNDFVHAFDGTSVYWANSSSEAKSLGEEIAKEFNPPHHLDWAREEAKRLQTKTNVVETKETAKE